MEEVFQYSLIMKSRSEINRGTLCMKEVSHRASNIPPFYSYERKGQVSPHLAVWLIH